MKFTREYESTLEQEHYPQHWIQSSISYRQLKKCIRKIQLELSQLGLDAKAVEHLLHSAGRPGTQAVVITNSTAHDISLFKPKLVFLVRIKDGDLIDVDLSPRTKEMLQKLVGTDNILGKEITPAQLRPQSWEDSQRRNHSTHSLDPTWFQRDRIPGDARLSVSKCLLGTNDEFFQILQHGLSGLNALHGKEKAALSQEIVDLSQVVSRVANPPGIRSARISMRGEQIFGLYLESNVFFSTNESESSCRTPAQVQSQLQNLDELQKSNTFHRKDSNLALQRFILVNANLLRSLKFQKLNMRAAGKILKSK
ncbi:MAG: hypothetical protein Q9209_002942 [Squamulea sp. 1 TL-2023]